MKGVGINLRVAIMIQNGSSVLLSYCYHINQSYCSLLLSIKRPPREAVEIAKIQRKLDLRLSALWLHGKEGAGEDGWVGCVANTPTSHQHFTILPTHRIWDNSWRSPDTHLECKYAPRPTAIAWLRRKDLMGGVFEEGITDIGRRV